MIRIGDMRDAPRTLAEADEVMREIAVSECAIATSAARCEQEILAAKQRHEERTREIAAHRDNQVAILTQFVQSHAELFRRPRKHVCAYGAYGMRTVSDLKITNEETLLTFLLEQGYTECVKTSQSPVKTAIKARLSIGETLPGCIYRSGDTAVYEVEKSMLDRAREAAAAEK